MEFLRFGSSIPGGYWGCCAFDIIQNFKQDPDEKASISVVNGDGGYPICKDGKVLFLGPTWRDIFKQRLRINTFNTGDKPNHGFLAVLTDWQVSGNDAYGTKWLKILKEEGFEFLRTVDNSVYSGSSVISDTTTTNHSSHKNYLFGLFRNIGMGNVGNPYTPPKAWLEMEQVVPEAWQYVGGEDQQYLTERNQAHHLKRWAEIGPVKFMTEDELDEQGIPVTYAGVRSRYPEQDRDTREALQKEEQAWVAAYQASQGKADLSGSIFGNIAPVAASSVPEAVEEYDEDCEEYFEEVDKIY